MLIKYRYSINGQSVNPIVKEDIAKEYEMEPQQVFFRAGLSGVLKFVKADYDWIMGEDFETEFVVLIEKSNDSGSTWSDYFTGYFFKADCNIDEDDEKIEVKLQTKDDYVEILAGMDKEFDLLKLPMAKTPLQIDKRPLIQVYEAGSDVISCFLGGSSWEQDVSDPVSDASTLENTYHFSLASSYRWARASGNGVFNGQVMAGLFIEGGTVNIFTGRNLEYEMTFETGDSVQRWYVYRVSDSQVLFDSGFTTANEDGTYTMTPSYTGVTGILYAYLAPIYDDSVTRFYLRYLLDVDTFLGSPTFDLPVNDITADNRNYKKVIGYDTNLVSISIMGSETPTIYGQTDDGFYFLPPYSPGTVFYPIAQSKWAYISTWFNYDTFDYIIEEAGRKAYSIKDGLLVSDVIKALLAELDPDIDHDATDEYSEFLYGETNPITLVPFRMMITPKSNIIAGEYTQPAMKAPITMAALLSMLRDTMQVYWYIEDGKLKLEHISFFRNGGSYTGTPVISYDLTTAIQKRNGLPWAYSTSKYNFDKPDMTEQYEFKWMDDVTEGFEGYPIKIVSKYVQRGKIETINLSTFTSDVDYMLVNSESINKDGFALFAAVWETDHYELPYVVAIVEGAELRLQNGIMSFVYLLPTFWVYNLPSYNVEINKETASVLGIERKKKQKISFPVEDDPDPIKLVKTYLGSGQIQKISVNLHSRLADIMLMYDTQ